MIYLTLIFISIIYFLLLYKNYGESLRLKKNSINMNIIFIILFFGIVGLFFKDSGILNKKGYDEILEKHQQIRNNIVTIKENIPILRAKLIEEPEYYEGWVMLAKSYIITDDLLSSIDSYEMAMSINTDDNSVLIEYIDILRKIDPKSNKTKIIKSFDKLISSNPSDIGIYNMKLNYSVEINDSNLTKNILQDIINDKSIINKDAYIQALNKLNLSANKFSFEITLSDKIFNDLRSSSYIYFILRDKIIGPPFAVKRIQNINLGKKITLTSQDKMIRELEPPENIILEIKGSQNTVVDDNMVELHKSKILDFHSSVYYEID